jgi:hypothetical protein
VVEMNRTVEKNLLAIISGLSEPEGCGARCSASCSCSAAASTDREADDAG